MQWVSYWKGTTFSDMAGGPKIQLQLEENYENGIRSRGPPVLHNIDIICE